MNQDRILVTGSSGFLGTSLLRVLGSKPIQILRLVRRFSGEEGGQLLWDPYGTLPIRDPSQLEGCTAAIQLSGANLAAGRWTSAYKDEILESRVKPTRVLATLLAGLRSPPRALVCASAIGIYGDRGEEILRESSAPGRGFLPKVCLAWEEAAQPARDAGIRVVHLRFSVVLSPRGGALPRMLPPFRLGLGGKIGDGRQWMSWVALPDALRAVEFALDTESLSEAVNVTSRNPVTNAEFTRTLGHVLKRPTFFRLPPPLLRLAFGEMAEATILASERGIPERLQSAGFQFEYSDLEAGLRAVLAGSEAASGGG